MHKLLSGLETIIDNLIDDLIPCTRNIGIILKLCVGLELGIVFKI